MLVIFQYDVLSITNKLKPKSSFSHNDIFTKLLKHTIGNIIQPVRYIINGSSDTGIVPNEMKIAKLFQFINHQIQVS